jgi:hypothetical protein
VILTVLDSQPVPSHAAGQRRPFNLGLVSICATLSLAATLVAASPRHVYLTWPSDPTTAITVNYHTMAAGEPAATEVRYDTVSHDGDADAYRLRAEGHHHRPRPGHERAVHTVQLTALAPGRGYWFVAGDPVGGFSAERAFRTIPAGDEPLRFVVGGDMGVGERAQRLQAAAAAQDPLFAVVGGDIAYANGDWAGVDLWDRWFDNWDSLMVTAAGFNVPIVAVIGNHEVAGGYGGTPADAAPYLSFLPQSAHTYYTRRIGSRVVLFVLDSGHVAPHGGRQTEWLQGQMAAAATVPVRLAAYHVPLFPVFRLPTSDSASAGRRHWQPLFDRYRLTAAFEHHDHAFKRTHQIRSDEVVADGTLYLGDGSWGRGPRWVRGPRKNHLARRWYMDRLESLGHVWRVDVGADSVVFAGVGQDAEIFDRVARPLDPRQ